jgi:hypothetical protein
MTTSHSCSTSRCPLVSRRCFLKTTGVTAVATHLGLFEKMSEVFGSPDSTGGKPKVRVAFMRPDVDKYWLGWPGASYDIKAREKQYSDILTTASQECGVHLSFEDRPVYGTDRVTAFLNSLKQNPPDGIILVITNCHHTDEQGRILKEVDTWGHTTNICKNRGVIPTIVFSPMGTSFTGHLNMTRDIPNVFTAATQDINWLSYGIRMLRTIYDMKQSRICIIRGDKAEDITVKQFGTTLHYIPKESFADTFNKTEINHEMRQIAEYYTREAKMIIEPSPEDILISAKNYVVIRHIMEQEKCNGFSMDCMSPIGVHRMKPPCVAMSRLQDEGFVGACEADWCAAISQRLTNLLFGLPGFIQDPAPNTVNNTLIGAHCTSPTKLNGVDQPHETFIIRNHSESAMGAAFQVIWKPGQRVTVMKITELDNIYPTSEMYFSGRPYTDLGVIVGTGTVVDNIDTPPAGGCRTSVEIAMDNCKDVRDIKGFHQLFIYGDLSQQFKEYCELAGIPCESIV